LITPKSSWGLCLAETQLTYETFFTNLNSFYLDEEFIFQVIMNKDTHVNISDRFKGIPAAQAKQYPNMRSKNCFKHMVPNMIADKGVKDFLRPAQSFAWKAQGATTKAGFELAMKDLKKVSPTAFAYLTKLDPKQWALHPDAMGQPLHGHRTSNLIESTNSKFLGVRSRAPLDALDAITVLSMEELSSKRRDATRRHQEGQGPRLTKYAEVKYEEQRRLSSQYTATESSTNVYFVQRAPQGTRYRVDLEQRTCQCTSWTQYKIPCRHAIKAAQDAGRLADFEAFTTHAFAPMYLMTNYVDALTPSICEVVDLASLVPDGITKPSLNIKQKGRPKQKRIRSRGHNAADGGTVPKKTKCGSCGGLGHNSTTCIERQWGQ
jgi:hypothetical protein